MAITAQQRAALGNFKRALHSLGEAFDAVIIKARIVNNRDCMSLPDVDMEDVEITQELIADNLSLADAISAALAADRGVGINTYQEALDKAREL